MTLETTSHAVAVPTSAGGSVTVHESTLATLQELFESSRAKNTKETYRLQAGAFSRWCVSVGARLSPGEVVPEEVVLLHLAHLRQTQAKFATVRARVAMLSKWHKSQGLPSPTDSEKVKEAVKGYENHLAEAAKHHGSVELLEKPSLPVMREHLHRVLATIDTTTTQGLRDRALFLLGWSGCFRVSEVVTLRTEHLTFREEGVVATCYATKTGKTIPKEIAREADTAVCPVHALEVWLQEVEKQTGEKPSLIFRNVTKAGKVGECLTRYGVSAIFKSYAKRAGLPEGKWSPHSLRAGFATQGKLDNIPEHELRLQGGWSASSAVFHRYVRAGEAFSTRRARVSR